MFIEPDSLLWVRSVGAICIRNRRGDIALLWSANRRTHGAINIVLLRSTKQVVTRRTMVTST